MRMVKQASLQWAWNLGGKTFFFEEAGALLLQNMACGHFEPHPPTFHI